MIKTYTFSRKWRTKAPAQVVGEECEKLERQGRLTAKDLVDESRPDEAPLHDEFEWRDPIAAELYREDQARHIIRCVCVVPEKSDAEPVRAFFNVVREEPQYRSIDAIISAPDLSEQLDRTIMRELTAVREKMRGIAKYRAVCDAIDQLEVGVA